MFRKSIISSAIIFAISSAPAVAKKKFLDVHALEFQESRMDRGIETIDSALGTTVVRIIESTEEVKKRGKITVLVYNGGDRAFNFGTENVQFALDSDDIVKVIPYEQLATEERKRQQWSGAFAALGAMGNSMSATNVGYNYGTFNAYGSGGGRVSGNYSEYNSGQAYAAQALANAENRAMFDRLNARDAAAMAALGVNLQTTTVDPGDVFGGQVVFELPKSVRKSKKPVSFVLMVKAGADDHLFVVSVGI